MSIYRHIVLAIALVGLHLCSFAQAVQQEIAGDMAVVQVDLKAVTAEIDSGLAEFGFNLNYLDSVCQSSANRDLPNGWSVWIYSDSEIVLHKPLSFVGHGFFALQDFVLVDPGKGLATAKGVADYPDDPTYGANKFKRQSVFESSAGNSIFYLPGHQEAEGVFLAASFNNWSTGSTPMTRTDSGWIAAVNPSPGKHLYKFIIDGDWVEDASNSNRERNQHNTWNSIYFKPNKHFYLKGYADAKKVYLASSANQWREKELRLQRDEDGWFLDAYFRQGTHAYKFIVDGKWITDPGNPVTKPDRHGHLNSFFSIGEATTFYLRGHKEARQVFIAGTFNDWSTVDPLTREGDGWKIDLVLPPGNYEYKFVIDGSWQAAQDNPYFTGPVKEEEKDSMTAFGNSVCAVYSNHTFRLEGFPDAKDVRLAGTFNHWEEPGYRMAKRGDVWEIPLYLPQGKTLYKFIVDGEWILDPANPLWEQNKQQTGNSIVWMELQIPPH